ncbi:MAG: hypothetical protein Q7T83_09700 [Thermodesulfovibrionales bacterium]|nr:hypothetical protein [Thermodesulfovibrionales bacterium]MDP3110554.1 hypothetical protein [Thermodesulfovibrionales bacterium]
MKQRKAFSYGGVFEKLMSAITFAEEGEHEKAKEILKGRKTVLLALSDKMFDRNAFKYALNVSKRIEASLEIIYVTEHEKENRLKDFMSEVEKVGFTFSLVVKKGCMKKAILGYTAKRNDIQFVVVGSETELEIGCEDEKALPDLWKGLKCPLVIVSKGEAPPIK